MFAFNKGYGFSLQIFVQFFKIALFDGTISEFNKGEFKNKLAFPKRVLLDFNFSWFEIGEVIRVSACFSFLYLYVIYNKTRGQFAYYFDTMQGDKKELKFNDGSAMYPS